MALHRRFVCVSSTGSSTSKDNSNKFWEAWLEDDGSVRTRWGRVGGSAQEKTYPGKGANFFDKKCREKMGRGYQEVKIVTEEAVTSSGDPVKEIAKGDKAIEDLVRYLKQRNVHNITSSTELTYDESTGLFSTPLGLVTGDTIDEARNMLLAAQGFLDKPHPGADQVAAKYMTLIPTNIGRDRPTFERLFPDAAAVAAQSAILDSLQGSLDMVASGGLAKPDAKPVFDVTLKEADDATVADVIQFYADSVNRNHEASRLCVNKVFTCDIAHMSEAYERATQAIKNRMRLWHGTSAGNILSIMARGLIINPKAAHGRMFGNGVYFSDQSTKSLNYAYGYWGNRQREDRCFMFIAAVAMGKAHTPSGGYQPNYRPPAGYDSCFAKAGHSGVQNNEMIIYRAQQCKITHLVEFGPR